MIQATFLRLNLYFFTKKYTLSFSTTVHTLFTLHNKSEYILLCFVDSWLWIIMFSHQFWEPLLMGIASKSKVFFYDSTCRKLNVNTLFGRSLFLVVLIGFQTFQIEFYLFVLMLNEVNPSPTISTILFVYLSPMLLDAKLKCKCNIHCFSLWYLLFLIRSLLLQSIANCTQD